MNQIDRNGENSIKVIGKALYKVVKTGTKKGLSSLNKGATYAEAFSDLADDVRTLTSAESSVGEKALAVVSLASEIVSPVGLHDVKDVSKLVAKTTDRISAMKRGKEAEKRVLKDMGLEKNTLTRRANLETEIIRRKDLGPQ